MCLPGVGGTAAKRSYKILYNETQHVQLRADVNRGDVVSYALSRFMRRMFFFAKQSFRYSLSLSCHERASSGVSAQGGTTGAHCDAPTRSP